MMRKAKGEPTRWNKKDEMKMRNGWMRFGLDGYGHIGTGMARHGFFGFGFFKNPIKPTMGLMGLISSVGIAQR
jgi:hypothetical protein